MGVRGYGQTLEEAFAATAEALTAVVVELSAVAPVESVELHCAPADPDLLLYDFLNAIIYEMVTSNRLFSRFRVRIDEQGLHARAWGEAVDVLRQQPAVEIKGATFTGLSVHRTPGGVWVAQCVLDI